MTEFKIGDIVEGQITGIQNYGVFVGLSPTEQGLVHISECKHGYMNELSNQIKVGDKVKVMIMFRGREQSRPEAGVRLLRRLADEGAAVVLVTHDPGAAALADSVLVMRDGAIIDRRRGAAPDELLAAMNRMGEAA